MLKIENDLIDTLNTYISNDYIYLDLPYYSNIGDALIWQGTENFLSTLPYRCVYRASIESYIKPDISTDTIILLQGGGNFGDIWRKHTKFLLRILSEFPDNRIILLPQTVYYKQKELMVNDAQHMALHKKFVIFVRDDRSYALVKKYFQNEVVLFPDMAFFINKEILKKYSNEEKKNCLVLQREDMEKSIVIKKNGADISDWPSMNKEFVFNKVLRFLRKIFYYTKKRNSLIASFVCKIYNLFAIKIYLPYLVKQGIRFISQYRVVYSTRLHGAILAALLYKDVYLSDNSYGKNHDFYKAWLQNLNNINIIVEGKRLDE